ncbi:hypothetical protein [Microbacterium yannicii]|uniref:hypothetical protein n=1 Tax=Microbacterium yannicii TaxID=671622 RepID=UPI0003735A19|nr:hypothetical protein [Microbacterium yannicii]
MQAPPHSVARREHGQEDAQRQRKHREAADAMRGGSMTDGRGRRIQRRIDGLRGRMGGVGGDVSRVGSGVRGRLERHVGGIRGRGENGPRLGDDTVLGLR